MTTLDRLIAEREPDPDALEVERRMPVPPYRDPFYGVLDQLVTSGIQAVLDGRYTRRPKS